MSLSITIKLSGSKDELAKIQKLGDKLTNFQDALTKIGDELKRYYGGQVFSSAGTVYGERWANLNPIYAAWKGKHYPGRGLLVASGHMKDSFTSEATKDSVYVSNSAPYFPFHQLGTRTMPRRQMIGVNSNVKNIVKQVIMADIKTKLEGV